MCTKKWFEHAIWLLRLMLIVFFIKRVLFPLLERIMYLIKRQRKDVSVYINNSFIQDGKSDTI